MVSGNIPLLETRKSWYKLMSGDQKKMIDRLKNLSCYRLSQGGKNEVSLSMEVHKMER